jgi:hypothetical protein
VTIVCLIVDPHWASCSGLTAYLTADIFSDTEINGSKRVKRGV